jgi:choline dehydrogenase-like flavoprotein
MTQSSMLTPASSLVRGPSKKPSGNGAAEGSLPPPAPIPARDRSRYSPRVFRSALALAEAIIPGRDNLMRADEQTLLETEDLLEHVFPHLSDVWGRAAQVFDHAAMLSKGRRFRNLPHKSQQEMLQRWENDAVLGPMLQAFMFPLKFAHFDRLDVYEALGGKRNVVTNIEQPRWLEQIVDASKLEQDEELECEVVVVGTGAGGAVVGRELAEKGYAVMFVEEGEHVRRDRFTGSSVQAHRDFYRGAAVAGNNLMPVFIGRLVGGSTAVNGGTSFRTPPWVLDRWCEEMGTSDFTTEAMAPHFEKVESILQVTPASQAHIGAVKDVFKKGCDALGYSHFTINRNAPGCEGSGFCDFGCRTDARRSTNLSYIPPALEKGAMLYTRCKAERVILEGKRAVGIEGVSPTGRKVRIRANAVIFSGGAVPTPLFLMKQGLANRSGQLGQNLTLHPSGGLSAVMPQRMDGATKIPQGYGSDEFLKQGILLTAAQPDFNYAALTFPTTGDRLMDNMGQLPWTATAAVLIADQTKGRVLMDSVGGVILRYDLGKSDVERYMHGLSKLAEIVFAAGAIKVMPALYGGWGELKGMKDVRAMAKASIKPGQIPLTSYHPLGTCKMGKDPSTSVVDLSHEVHDVPGLFIVDGSTVSGPLGVNPQLTIMAVATRAAEKIAERLG